MTRVEWHALYTWYGKVPKSVMPSNFDAALWQNSWRGCGCGFFSLHVLHSGLTFLLAYLLPAYFLDVPDSRPLWRMSLLCPWDWARRINWGLFGFTGFKLQPMWFLTDWLDGWYRILRRWLSSNTGKLQQKAEHEVTWSWKTICDVQVDKSSLLHGCFSMFFFWAILVPTLRRGRFWAFWLQVWTVLSSPSFGKQHKAPQETAYRGTTPTFTHWCSFSF